MNPLYVAGGHPDDEVSPTWMHSHVSHVLPFSVWVFGNILVFLEVLIHVDDIFCCHPPIVRWLDECQCSCYVHSTKQVFVSPHDAHNNRIDVLWVVPETPIAARIMNSCVGPALHGRLLSSESCN